MYRLKKKFLLKLRFHYFDQYRYFPWVLYISKQINKSFEKQNFKIEFLKIWFGFQKILKTKM